MSIGRGGVSLASCSAGVRSSPSPPCFCLLLSSSRPDSRAAASALDRRLQDGGEDRACSGGLPEISGSRRGLQVCAGCFLLLVSSRTQRQAARPCHANRQNIKPHNVGATHLAMTSLRVPNSRPAPFFPDEPPAAALLLLLLLIIAAWCSRRCRLTL